RRPQVTAKPPSCHTYTLSLHDALPISHQRLETGLLQLHLGALDHPIHNLIFQNRHFNLLHEFAILGVEADDLLRIAEAGSDLLRSEEHTSELQSRENRVCRLLLEKKKT